MKKFKTLVVTLISALTLLAPLAMPAVVYAEISGSPDIGGGLCGGSNLDVNNTTCDPQADKTGTEKVNSIIKTVINLFSLIVGVVAVVMIIVGGLKYITSGGDSGNISSAKNTIIFAIIGLVVVALAQFIVRFVLAKVTSPSSTTTGVLFLG